MLVYTLPLQSLAGPDGRSRHSLQQSRNYSLAGQLYSPGGAQYTPQTIRYVRGLKN